MNLVDDNNAYSFRKLNNILRNVERGFYFILARPDMQKQIADAYTSDKVAVYNYAGKENTFKPGEIYRFLDETEDKKVIFILNFQIPFFGKEVYTLQDDYLTLNLSRDVLFNDYGNRLLFFFMTPETEENLYLAAMDFSGYVNAKISFESIDKEHTLQEIQRLPEENENLHLKPEIEERLSRYQETIDKYLKIELADYDINNEKDKNYLLIAARDLSYIAELCDKIGKYEQAEVLLTKAIEIREKVLGTEHLDTATIYNNIAVVYDNQRDYPKALEFCNKALKIRKKNLGTEHPNTATTYNNIALVYDNQGDYPKALEFYNKALKIKEKVLGIEHPDTATTYNNIAAVYNYQGGYSKALELLNKALKIREKTLGTEHPDTVITYNNIAVVYNNQGDYSTALEFYNKSLKILEKVLGTQHPNTKVIRNSYNTLLNKIKAQFTR